jgi:putative ubiquitin-RnfH superfamily antitoxin RatB of RatAB toxin-antitoxin module
MENSRLLRIQVCWATPEQQQIRELELPAPVTLEQAVRASGILDDLPDVTLADNEVGVFSERRKLGDKLRDGDRVEIYRPLLADPKEVRRKRAELKKRK